MHHLDDIRVNGQAAIDKVPVIAGLHPVISWDFIEDPAAPSQVKFELMIGTSNTRWGLDSFAANIHSRDDEFTGNFFEYETHNLTRGVTYFGQIRVDDIDNQFTPWITFSFTINKLPFVTGFKLTPSSPLTVNNIDLTYDYFDADNHEEAGTKIRWFRNNLPMPQYDDLCTLPANASKPGDSWSAKIIPSDGLEFGSIVETAAVTVEESDFGFETIIITPTRPNIDDLLKVAWALIDNAYLASLNGTIVIEWFINGVAVSDSDRATIRLKLTPGDVITVAVKLVDNDAALAQGTSKEVTIQDVIWHIYDLEVSGLFDPVGLTDLSPALEWKIYKSQSSSKPAFLRVAVTKTPSIDSPLWDTGTVAYTNNSYVIPEGSLKRGQDYHIHVGASDTTPVPVSQLLTQKIEMAGSSWDETVNSTTGWTIEFKVSVENSNAPEPEGDKDPILPSQGLYIHDGTHFCAITLAQKTVTFLSDTTVVYTIPKSVADLQTSKTFRIAGLGQDVKIFMDNLLIIDAVGLFTNLSQLKRLEYGDIDARYTNSGFWRMFRYTTSGALGFGSDFTNENVFHFHEVGQIQNGSIEYILDNLIAWTPDNVNESSKLLQFNENGDEIQLPTVAKNFSPITSIFIDKDRNKFVATANGVTAIFGEKHDPDFEFLTSDADVVITSDKFDRITTVATNNISKVETDEKLGWFTIDTTVDAIGERDLDERFLTGDPYDPYGFGIKSHAIHYYSQRTHGHSWYDRVDNKIGWQVSFSFQLVRLEQDDFQGHNLDHKGFGIYVNDGAYQEILYFYEDRIRFFYANVYIPIINTVAHDFRIVAKDNNLLIYQKISATAAGAYQLLYNGSGTFTTPATRTGNSRNPKIVFDSKGLYHSVWHDDSKQRSQILYSLYDGATWSNPELVTESTEFNLRNPSITVDSQGRAWVVYEDTSFGPTELSVSVKDSAGWNPKVRLTNTKSKKAHPQIEADAFDNIHVVWEDDRNGPSQILWTQWDNKTQAWLSSGQFGTDTVVMQQHDDNDPYMSGDMQFRNPKIRYAAQKLWLVCEGLTERDIGKSEYGVEDLENVSVIYRGFRNLDLNQWHTSGSIVRDESGNFIGIGQSSLSSSIERKSVKPDLAINESLGLLVITWEDQSEPISQIWGSAYNLSSTELNGPTQITSRFDGEDNKNPSIGFVSNMAVILFEDGSHDIRRVYYNGTSRTFRGTKLGNDDLRIQIGSTKTPSHPAMPPFTSAKSFLMVYDFLRKQDGTIQALEFPAYDLIGTASITHAEGFKGAVWAITTTDSDGMVSNLDTKEFAFGDMADNVGMLAHWKDIQMYFGYDARPMTLANFSTVNIDNWPDNRVNDLYVDVFGNLIVATFGGLAYHNVFTGDLTNIDGRTSEFSENCTDATCILRNKIITAVKWGKNGIWYVGTSDGAYFTSTAGKLWEQFELPAGLTIFDITVNKDGEAILGTSNGIYIVNKDSKTMQNQGGAEPLFIDITATVTNADGNIRNVAVDESDIIWAGSDVGLLRIENRTNFMTFNRNSGMRSNHVTDIVIVNKHLRYIATANGVNRMHGTRFYDLTTQSHDILNNNIASLQWDASTNSLWVASLYKLHEIVFVDEIHEVIADEVTHYDSTELLTEQSYNKNIYFVLDLEEIQPNLENPIELNTSSAKVFINKNEIKFGFLVDEIGSSIIFDTDLLASDEVEVLITNKFIDFHDFNQTGIEKKVVGEKRRGIFKLQRTSSHNQLLVLSGIDKHELLLFLGEARLPFTSILLDRDPPIGCLEKLETLTRTQINFKILASDRLSGLNGYILSNFENFTSDGILPIDFTALPEDGIVTHDIGEGINNVFISLNFAPTVKINNVEYTVGDGKALGLWTDRDTSTEFLYAFTDAPALVFRFDQATTNWTILAILDSNDLGRKVTRVRTFNNVMFITTEATNGTGLAYKTTDGSTFEVVTGSGSILAQNAIAGSPDGAIYFGDGSGNIYVYRNNLASLIYTGIGESIESLDFWQTLLIAGTGNAGRVYIIDTESDSNLIIFDGSDKTVDEVHIKDALTVNRPELALLYLGLGDSTTIYRSNLDTFDFIKSYSSLSKTIHRIATVDTAALTTDPLTGDDPVSTVIAAIGDTIFKHNVPAWEFLYKNDEEIVDVVQYRSGGKEGLFLISKSKVTKWTAELLEKTVYLRLRDKASNFSDPPILDPKCPTGDITENPFCCNYAYSINLEDIKNFINESRIIDVDANGTIIFTYDAPNDRIFYSAEQIDEEVGIYTSEIFNGSNDLVSWKSIQWSSVEPPGTRLEMQIRTSVTETRIEEAEFSPNLPADSKGFVPIEHITDQYLQFRAILTSTIRQLSPTLTSVVLRNLTTQASHFFTTNFVMPSRPVKGLLTANTFLPVSTDIVFGLNTKNSSDFSDYQIIEPNRVFTTSQSQFGSNFKIGAKLLSPGIPQLQPSSAPGDPYDAASFICIIDFTFENIDSETHTYHFRVRFYNDLFRTQLIHTFYSGNDQTGWQLVGGKNNTFPAGGIDIIPNTSQSASFTPLDQVESSQRWYVTVDAFNSTNFETISDNMSFICSPCNLVNEPGLVGEYYKSGLESLTSIPNFSSLIPDFIVIETNIDFPERITNWITSQSQELEGFTSDFAARFRGLVQIPVSGTYQFSLQSDDGSLLFINNEEIINHDSIHSFTSKSGSVFLSEGFHDIEIHYFEGTGSAGLQLRWLPPGTSNETVVPQTNLFHAVATEYCDLDNIPQILNFAVQFELENGETVKMNLTS